MIPIKRITLLTNPYVCNLHCPLCFLNQRPIEVRYSKWQRKEMPFSVAKAAILKYEKTLFEVIPSTMGEPLLYSHFNELMRFCKSRGILLNVTTNGTFPEKSVAFLKELLMSSSDIKISCMGFSNKTFEEMMPGISFDAWKSNVIRFLEIRESLIQENKKVATLSLQVTLHKKNVKEAFQILRFAEDYKIYRIKWNKAFFLSILKSDLKERYALDSFDNSFLRSSLHSSIVECSGNFFTENIPSTLECTRFLLERWILPDGKEEFCPNPDLRFGQISKEQACANCPMRGA